MDYQDRPHTVYLHRDAAGKVLYVGCTSNLKARTAHHSRTGRWADVATVEVDSIHPRDVEGLARERELIHLHEPPRNTRHNPAVQREDEAWQTLGRKYGLYEAMRVTANRTAVEALLAIRDAAVSTAMRRTEQRRRAA